MLKAGIPAESSGTEMEILRKSNQEVNYQENEGSG